MNTYTSLDTLSRAWDILADIGLDKLLLGQQVPLQAETLLNALFAQRKLEEFLCVITRETAETVKDMELPAIIEVITSFFLAITGSLNGLAGIMENLKTPPPTPSAPPASTPSGQSN